MITRRSLLGLLPIGAVKSEEDIRPILEAMIREALLKHVQPACLRYPLCDERKA